MRQIEGETTKFETRGLSQVGPSVDPQSRHSLRSDVIILSVHTHSVSKPSCLVRGDH